MIRTHDGPYGGGPQFADMQWLAHLTQRLAPIDAAAKSYMPKARHHQFEKVFERRKLLLALEVFQHLWATKSEPTFHHSYVVEHEEIVKWSPVGGDNAAIRQELVELDDAMYLQREQDAAALLNKAHLYDPRVGGDGVALCSDSHPLVEAGTWSNIVVGNIRDGVEHIKRNSVDPKGRKIVVRPVAVIVNSDDVGRTTKEVRDADLSLTVIGLDHLDKGKRFIKTDVPGLVAFERKPIEFTAFIVMPADGDCHTFIKALERRSFGYYDPRSIIALV